MDKYSIDSLKQVTFRFTGKLARPDGSSASVDFVVFYILGYFYDWQVNVMVNGATLLQKEHEGMPTRRSAKRYLLEAFGGNKDEKTAKEGLGI